ncbi:UNVERIFIED_CONTAM: hypothetical protein Slati_4345700 [Sesamum latifolium]|uniref:Late embryogenesis abundant protein LEA-2 subgroup domain-containing protein n=1 Tax=Sesamum latifolium TaxID=2727402 RepID=A0AAW2SNY7_9LAMI
MPKPKQFGPRNHTNPLIWCAAIICAIISVLVIITGIFVFLGYLTIKPKVPKISVGSASLDTIYFDQTSLLTVQVTVVIRAENDNAKAHASFSHTRFALNFRGQTIAYLVNDPFSVSANSSVDFNYVSQSSPIPLNPEAAEAVNLSLRQGVMVFELKGTTRTRWRVGLIGSVTFPLYLDCQLRLPVDKRTIYPRCSSRSEK